MSDKNWLRRLTKSAQDKWIGGICGGLGEHTPSGKPHYLKEGDILLMPAGEPHALKAIKRFKMMLIMIRS